MKKNLLAIIALATVLATGCRKEKENIDTTPPRRLTKIEQNNNGNKYNTTFKYDSYGYMSEEIISYESFGMGNQYKTTTTYLRDANHRITEEHFDNTSLQQVGYYSYNANGQLQQIEYRTNNTTYSIVKFSYLNDKVVRMDNVSPESDFVHTEQYTYTNDNITEVTITINGGVAYSKITNIIYDDKINPLSTINGMPYTLSVDGPTFKRFSANNIVSLKNVGQGYTTQREYELEYSNLNYLKKEYQNDGNLSRTYTYEIY